MVREVTPLGRQELILPVLRNAGFCLTLEFLWSRVSWAYAQLWSQWVCPLGGSGVPFELTGILSFLSFFKVDFMKDVVQSLFVFLCFFRYMEKHRIH